MCEYTDTVQKWINLLDNILDESGSAGFGEKLLIRSRVDNLLHLPCQIVRSCHQRGMVVAMAIDDGFGGCCTTTVSDNNKI